MLGPNGTASNAFCYHIFLIPKDVQLKDAIGFAHNNSIIIATKAEEHMPKTDRSLVVRYAGGHRSEDCYHVEANEILRDDLKNFHLSIPFSFLEFTHSVIDNELILLP